MAPTNIQMQCNSIPRVTYGIGDTRFLYGNLSKHNKQVYKANILNTSVMHISQLKSSVNFMFNEHW